MHVLSAGDLDARYLGSRATLEPLFASYGMPANSDYAPVLDLNAARQRFMERSATELVALAPCRSAAARAARARPQPPSGEPAVTRARMPSSASRRRASPGTRATFSSARAPRPRRCRRSCRRISSSCKLRLLECREPRELDVWLHSALRVARAVNPYLAARRRRRGVARDREHNVLFHAAASSSGAGSSFSPPWRRATRRAWRGTRRELLDTHAGARHRCARIPAARSDEPAASRTGDKPAALRALARPDGEAAHAGRAGVSPAALPRRGRELRGRVQPLRGALKRTAPEHRAHEALSLLGREVAVEEEVREPVHQSPRPPPRRTARPRPGRRTTASAPRRRAGRGSPASRGRRTSGESAAGARARSPHTPRPSRAAAAAPARR